MLPVFSRQCLFCRLLLLLVLQGDCPSENNQECMRVAFVFFFFFLSFAVCYYLSCPQQKSERFS